jgi:dihydroflavonol-4-reductase
MLKPMFPTSSKILITGATGFLGSYILRKLSSEGYKNIVCIKRPDSSLEMSIGITDVEWATGDIMDIGFLDEITKGVDIIIHAAAIVTFDPRSFKKMITTAMEGTANLVNAALCNGVSKFVHISSVAALGRRRKEETISEKNIFSKSKYDTTYGLSKFLAEQEVWRGHAEGLNTTILNPSMVLGAGKWHDSSVQIFKRVNDGLKYFPSGMTGWVDVRDVATVVFQSMTSQYNGERYIISSGNHTYQSIFEKIANHLHVHAPKQSLSSRMGNLLWRLESVRSWLLSQKPVITRETVVSMSAKSQYVNEKSVQELNLRYTTIEKTIEDTCEAFLSSYPKGIKSGILDI